MRQANGLGIREACVVGAGAVGLSTAWFLQEFGVSVTIIEASRVGAGSSWGNAGWVAPSLAAPLPEPGLVGASVRSMLRGESPLSVQFPPDLGLIRFVGQFLSNSHRATWTSSLRALVPLARDAQASFDALTLPPGILRNADLLVAFTREADRDHFEAEVTRLRECGQAVTAERITLAELRDGYPIVATKASSALLVKDQRYVDPRRLVTTLAGSVESRGGRIQVGQDVVRVTPGNDAVVVHTVGGSAEPYDAAVIATGAWLNILGNGAGMRTNVQAGRGYSFHLPAAVPPPGPLYFPAQRVACTPTSDGVRVTGLMEFARPSSTATAGRVAALTRIAKPLLTDVEWLSASDAWVGSRPCTPDGLPLLGATAHEGLFIAGGHGMWGITLSATSGRNLAQLVVSGQSDVELARFSPLRRGRAARSRIGHQVA